MLQRLPFKRRIILLPIVAGIGFVLILVANWILGARNADNLDKIQRGYVPALELSVELEGILASLQRAMQDAVAAEDVEALGQTTALRDEFAKTLAAESDNPVLTRSEIAALGEEFSGYYEQALATSEAMVRATAGEGLVQQMEAMRGAYTRVRDLLGDQTRRSKEGMTRAFAAAGAAQDTSVLILALASGLFLLLLVVLSVIIARAVSNPLSATSTLAREAAVQISASVQQHNATIQETATSVSQTSTTVDEIRQTSEMAAQKARDVTDITEQSIATSQDAMTSINRGIDAMRAIRSEVEAIATNILELSERHIQIGEIVQTVNAIAEQSNLLAVNASIEAAKAGEQGRGFSVVAREVRALAGQSKEATRQIRSLLGEIQKASNAAVMVTERGTKRVQEGSDVIEALGGTIRDFGTVIEDSAEASRQIALTAGQQLAGLQHITTAMKAIEQATQESAAGAQQLEEGATQIESISGRIAWIVDGGQPTAS